MKILFIILIAVVQFSIFNFQFSKRVFADTSCEPIYGGGQSCIISSDIAIDKKVLNPKTNKLVDNLNINDPKYFPGFIANFTLTITNTSNSTIDNITVKDMFPQYVSFGSGPGAFNKKTKTLSFNIKNLKSKESKTFTVTGRIAKMDQISIDQGAVVCVVNQANATSQNNNFSQDNSQFCIQKSTSPTPQDTKGGFPVLSPSPIKTTPATGPGTLSLIALLPTGLLGWYLRKKSKSLNK
jgi:uncharacterized repeat protein (TIGR01451 family)